MRMKPCEASKATRAAFKSSCFLVRNEADPRIFWEVSCSIIRVLFAIMDATASETSLDVTEVADAVTCKICGENR